jgi:four helix bundle protein
MDKNSSFTTLEVWKKSRELKIKLFELIKQFPAEEKYSLSDQIIRSVRSISANIAEGHGRYTYKDQLHFCIISRGSLSETYNHIIDAFDCKYITEQQLVEFEQELNELHKLLNGYISFIRKNIIK